MIDAGKLLADLKRLRKVLDADLRETHASGAQRDAVQAEWREAFDLCRTRDTFEAFLDGAFDQAIVHWVLGCVFLRFLEDNRLVDRPFLSGPGERLDIAKERQEAHFRARPHDSDTEYLLTIFGEAAGLPGMAGLFDPAHNPLFRLGLSGDGAMALIRFFREVQPESGELANDFTDPDWNTRFLGDLYQDLSEEARKRYALLQTPDFVESWILDQTLEPAIREFGHEQVTMIDPACGSGHFLLGGFTRLLREWQRFEPGLPPAEQAQRALGAVAGVDLNPFAVEIARFRLLIAALRAADVHRLAAAPGFVTHLAAGDSLLHGQHFFRGELGGAAEGFRRVLRHHYATEDTAELDHILGRQYHVVVGNPPYITPKDAAMRDAYREIFESCHMKYPLAVPFIERFFDLAETATHNRPAGFVGMIVANSFMKREFGKKLIEQVLPRLDLSHVVDCSGAYIPGHGTPTAILFGRNRAPVASVVRAVMGIRGEPTTPADPGSGLVWSAIVEQTEQVGSTSAFVSVADISRATFSRHPWSIGGGGAANLKEAIEGDRRCLESIVAVRRFTVMIGSKVVTRETTELGFASFPGLDDAFFLGTPAAIRLGIPDQVNKPLVTGEYVRDWCVELGNTAFAPYDSNYRLLALDPAVSWARHLWHYRTCLAGTVSFGGETKANLGAPWWGWYRWIAERYQEPLSLTFASVATHNHFVLDRGGNVFNRHAPVIKLNRLLSEADYIGLLGLLNSSLACFWMKAIFHNKGSTVDNQGARQRTAPFEDFYEFAGTGLLKFPIADPAPLDLARELDAQARRLSHNLPTASVARSTPDRAVLELMRELNMKTLAAE
jgi:hypothetical protein